MVKNKPKLIYQDKTVSLYQLSRLQGVGKQHIVICIPKKKFSTLTKSVFTYAKSLNVEIIGVQS